jgi:hypothetical protein
MPIRALPGIALQKPEITTEGEIDLCGLLGARSDDPSRLSEAAHLSGDKGDATEEQS